MTDCCSSRLLVGLETHGDSWLSNNRDGMALRIIADRLTAINFCGG